MGRLRRGQAALKDFTLSERRIRLDEMELDGLYLRVSRDTDLHMDNSYYLPGYEQPNEKASEAIKMLARLEGLFVDPVYTGKALAGLIDHIRTGKVEPGSNVVFWHTGGATALFAEKSMLGDIF